MTRKVETIFQEIWVKEDQGMDFDHAFETTISERMEELGEEDFATLVAIGQMMSMRSAKRVEAGQEAQRLMRRYQVQVFGELPESVLENWLSKYGDVMRGDVEDKLLDREAILTLLRSSN